MKRFFGILIAITWLAWLAARPERETPPPQAQQTPMKSPKTDSIGLRDPKGSEKRPAPALIPGLAPVDVYLNLESKGFTTSKNFGAEQSDFICASETAELSLSATIYMPARAPSTVSVVTASATYLGSGAAQTTERVGEFLGYIATLPYDGAQPEAARRWVEQNNGRKAERVFGPVRYELFANGRSRVLRLSPAPAP